MSWKAIAAAALMACAIAPANAWDTGRDAPHTMFFIKLPLDAHSAREQLPSWGFTLRTRSDLPAFTLESRAVDRFVQMGFVESKLVLVGVVAAAGFALAAAGGGGSSVSREQQEQAAQKQASQLQAQQQAASQQQATARQPATPPQPKAPCPKKPAC